MGLFGLGGGGKVPRLVKKVTNKWTQPPERQRAMQQLADIGDEAALSGLLMRFTYRTDGAIHDEEEKRLAYELLVEAGERAIIPIEAFVEAHDGVYWPLRVLKEVAGTERAVDLLLRALDRAEMLEQRVNEQRAQLVSNLRDFPHPRVFERLKGLCEDPVDDVRIMAIDALMTYGEDKAKEIVARRLLNPDESPRIKSVLFEQLVENEWTLSPWQALMEEAAVLPAHYRFGPKGNIKRAG